MKKKAHSIVALSVRVETPMTTSHLRSLRGIEEVSNCPYKLYDVLERSLRLFVTNKR